MAIKMAPVTEKPAGYNTSWDNLRPMKPGECPRTVYDLPPLKKHTSIKSFLSEMHDEECSGEVLTAFRHYFPKIKRMTMREAWLRIVYMEAIAAHPWASMFIADRSEGKVGEGGIANDKGTILAAVEQMLNNPIQEETE
jgi:hypothetical protein